MDDVIDDDDDDYYYDESVGASGQAGNGSGVGTGNGGVLMSRSSRFSDAVLSAFLVVWFVCGNCWVFGVRRPIHFQEPLHQAPNNWCNRTVFLFAFVQIIACYIVAGLLAAVAALLIACRRIMAASSGGGGGPVYWFSEKS